MSADAETGISPMPTIGIEHLTFYNNNELLTPQTMARTAHLAGAPLNILSA